MICLGRTGVRIAVCAAIAASVWSLHAPAHTENAPTSGRIKTLWSRPSKTPVSVAITPGGSFICTLTIDDNLSYYNGSGRLLWRKNVEGAEALAMSADGRTILTYAPLNPLNRHITILHSDGKVLWKQEVSACVWSAAVSRDGSTAAVGTGDKRVYVYAIGDNRLKYRRRAWPGIPVSLTFDAGGERIVSGLWQDSGLGMWALDGREVWRHKGKSELAYNASVSANSDRVLCRAEPNRPDQNVTLIMANSDGKHLWQKRLKVDDVRTGMSVDGKLVAASYSKRINRKGRSFSERRLALYNSAGAIVWEKGGMFSKPELMCMLPGNCILVSSENTMLYLLDARGRTVSKLKLDARILQYHPAQTASRSLLYCGDGQMRMIAVEPD